MADSSEQLTNGVGFGPSQFSPEKLGVFAPLDVQGPKAQAALLAQSLGVVEDRMQRPLMYAEEAEGRGQAKVQAAQGALDATTGNVNPDTFYQQTQAYQRGAKTASVQQNVLKAINGFQQLQGTPQEQGGFAGLPLDDAQQADGTTKPGLMTSLDQYMKKQLGGLENDPEAAPVIEPMLTHFYNEVAGKAIQKQNEDNIATAVSNTQALAFHAFTTGDARSFNWQQQFDTLTALGVNKPEAAKYMVHALGEAAVQAGDPSLIDKFKPTDLPPGVDPFNVPANAAYLDQARARATEVGLKNKKGLLDGVENTMIAKAIKKQDITDDVLGYLKAGGDYRFAIQATNFADKLEKDGDDSAADGATAAQLTSMIARGEISSPRELADWVDQSGAKGKAANQLLTKGLTTLNQVPRDQSDDPTMKAMLDDLNGRYKPQTDPYTGAIPKPAEAVQHAGVMFDFRLEYQKQLKDGKPSELAAKKAYDNVREKWGDPLVLTGKESKKAILTDVDQMSAIKSRDSTLLMHSGMTSRDLLRLRELGMISDDDVNAAASILNTRYHK